MNAIAIRNQDLPEPALKTTVIYDDFAFAARATALLEQVLAHAGRNTHWDVRPWRFDLLNRPTLGEAVKAETVGADLLVLAFSRAQAPPQHELMDWLEDWALHRRIPDAAVVLLSPRKSAATAPFGVRLRRFAESHGLTFLSSDHAPNETAHPFRHGGLSE